MFLRVEVQELQEAGLHLSKKDLTKYNHNYTIWQQKFLFYLGTILINRIYIQDFLWFLVQPSKISEYSIRPGGKDAAVFHKYLERHDAI